MRFAPRLDTACAAAGVAAVLIILMSAAGSPARAAEQWNFYMHQSAPNFATSRGAKLFTEEIEKATGGELKVRLHLSGTLQINASNITQAVGENVVQIGDDLFNSGNIQVAGIPRLPMLIQSYEDFAKADAVLAPYIEKAFAQKGSTVLASYTYPLQFMWGRKKLESLEDIKGMKLRVAQPEQGEFVRRFGGTSITMSAPEVPSAIDRGVVDGIFTAGVGAVLWKDLLKYGYVLIVNVNNSYFIANTDAYNKLSPDLQAKLRQVANLHQLLFRKVVNNLTRHQPAHIPRPKLQPRRTPHPLPAPPRPQILLHFQLRSVLDQPLRNLHHRRLRHRQPRRRRQARSIGPNMSGWEAVVAATAEGEAVRIMTGTVAPARSPADYLARNCCGGGAVRPLARLYTPRRTS